jgi:bla regulator protein blaR1
VKPGFRKYYALMLIGLANVAGIWAQSPGIPAFEVASVKPGDSSGRGGVGFRPGGIFTATDASLQKLIGFAYDVRNHQIAGGPAWLDSAPFNIEAKAAGAVPIPAGPDGAQTIRLMLQSLLAERFKLVVHRVTREEQLYELVVNKGGAKLKESMETRGQLRMGKGQFTGIGAPLSILAAQLSQQLGRSVIDKTGLTGKYDFTLIWAPDPGAAGGVPAGTDAAQAPDSSGPSIFAAVQEDLGLKLQPGKGPVEMVVIDHVEKPDSN